MYNKRAVQYKGRWCRLTIFGLSTQGLEARRRKAYQYPGAITVNAKKGGRGYMVRPEEREPREAVVSMLDTLEMHAYGKLAQCIDTLQLEEARQIVGLLKDVGIV